MDLPDSCQARESARLRGKYQKAALSLIMNLESSQEHSAYPSDKLNNLGVFLVPFDPDDQDFIHSKACLFRPLSSKVLEGYSLDESDLRAASDGTTSCYFDFDEIYDRPTEATKPSSSYVAGERAYQIFCHLDILYTHYEKKSRKNLHFFDEISGWNEMKVGNSFLDLPMGLMLGACREIQDWDTKSVREWQEDDNKLDTAFPHIMFVTCTGAEAKDDELLYSELGSIAQAIHNRLSQKEFEKTSHFPVLVVSLFGPRHGRLLQAKFKKSGDLEIRASLIYSFRYKDEAPSKLFLRYYACEPKGGPEYEFYDEEEDVPVPTLEHVPRPPGASKESVPP